MNIPSKFRSTLAIVAITTVGLGTILFTPQQVHAQGVGDTVSNFFDQTKNQITQLYLRAIPGPKSGKAVLQQSLVEMENLDSFYFNNSIAANVLQESQQIETLTLTMSGFSDVTTIYEPTNSQQELHLTGNYQTNNRSFSVVADIITTIDKLYIRFSETPTIAEFSLFLLEDQWMMIDKPGIDQADQLPSQELSEEQQRQLQQATKDLVGQTEVSQAQKRMEADTPIFVIQVTLPDEAIVNYAERVSQITNGEFDREKLIKDLDQFDPFSATVWVDQNSFYIRHLESNLSFSETAVNQTFQQANPLIANVKQINNIEVTLTADLSEFNQPVTFSVPEDAQPAKDVIENMIGQAAAGQMNGEFLNMYYQGNLGDMGNMENLETMEGIEMMDQELATPQPTTGVPELPSMTDEQMRILEQYGY